MYREAAKYDDLLRITIASKPDEVKECRIHVAQSLEMNGHYAEAEKHYIEAGEWQTVVNMWRANDQWDEAIRVAKTHGGIDASKRLALAWATSLGNEDGAKLLDRLNLPEEAVEFALQVEILH